MNSLGVYFGPGLISIVESKGKKMLNSIQIPRSNLNSGSAEEKVPDELKMVALLKDELRKNNITSDKACVTLAGKELIIRTFEMPVLPHSEIQASVNFEARKYIPFKIEELVLSYQIFYDRSTKKNLVLLVGIKKEVMDKYLSIFNQLEQKIISLEYSAFSILRFFKLSQAKTGGIIAAVSLDMNEQDEVNFMVLQNGFPLFSRDIILTDETLPESSQPANLDPAQMLEKIKAELRISLDFYRRKFPTKNINRIVILAPEEFHSDIEAFVKERNTPCQFIDYKKCVGKPVPYSSSTFKAFGNSLAQAVNTGIKIDLLDAKEKDKVKAAQASLPLSAVKNLNLAEILKIDFKVVALAVLICVFTFIYGLYQKLPLQKEINS
ncbi:MAG: pilus assembly protein PilM, partial [Candidatus Omnitrophica bacterium]|nr:pilus assembly protein PilM [Candidatus Omnitrophota bacterium]